MKSFFERRPAGAGEGVHPHNLDAAYPPPAPEPEPERAPAPRFQHEGPRVTFPVNANLEFRWEFSDGTATPWSAFPTGIEQAPPAAASEGALRWRPKLVARTEADERPRANMPPIVPKPERAP